MGRWKEPGFLICFLYCFSQLSLSFWLLAAQNLPISLKLQSNFSLLACACFQFPVQNCYLGISHEPLFFRLKISNRVTPLVLQSASQICMKISDFLLFLLLGCKYTIYAHTHNQTILFSSYTIKFCNIYEMLTVWQCLCSELCIDLNELLQILRTTLQDR